MAIAVLAIDFLTPLGVADGMLYVPVVLLASQMSYQWAGWIAASGCTALILGAILPVNAWQFSIPFEVAANRALAIMTVWATMILTSQKQRVVSALQKAEHRYQAVVALRRAEEEREALMRTLGDRVKQLTLLQEIAHLFMDQDRLLKDIVTDMVCLIPSGCQDPKVCVGQAVVDGVVFQSSAYVGEVWKTLHADISVNGTVRGSIKLVYVQKPHAPEPSFLEEEQNLLTAIARQCAVYLENRHMQAALRQSEQRFRESAERTRLMIDALPVLVSYIDCQYRYQENNECYRRWFGTDPQQLRGQHIRDVLGREAFEIIKPQIDLALTGTAVQFEAAIPYRNGGTRAVHGEYIPHRDAEGTIVGFYALIQDVSAKRLAESERAVVEDILKRRDAILQAVSFAAKQFVLAVAWDSGLSDVLRQLGRAAAVDHACVFRVNRMPAGDCEMSLEAEWVDQGIPSKLGDINLQHISFRRHGITRWAHCLSRGIPIACAVSDLPVAEQAITSIRNQRSVAVIPIFAGQEWWGVMVFGLIREERTWQPAEIDALQLAASTLGAGVQRIRMEGQIRLYTEELEQLVTQRADRIKELESQRAQAEKLAALGQLAAGVAHEINNPIAGIKNAFLILKDGIPTDYPYYHFVGMIEREIERVTSIVRRMYDMYQSESKKEELLAINDLVVDLRYLLQAKLAQRRIRLLTDVDPAIPQLHLVRRDIIQVLLNLVQNAIEASPEEGEIVLSVARDREEHVRFTVSDGGYGICPDELPHIFEPFFSGSRKRKQGGMGLGLSVSYSLVHALGGKIEVASQPNKGATFIVVLPITAPSLPHVKL